MNKYFKGLALSLGCGVCTAFVMSSCVDSNYDLNNLNTDIQVNVNDLVIPFNLDTIKLRQVMKVKDGDIIQLDTMFNDKGQQVIDPKTGRSKMQYVAMKEGTFTSKEIKIPGFTAKAPTIPQIEAQIDLSKLFGLPDLVKKNGRRMDKPQIPSSANDTIAAYILSSKPTFFKATATGINKSLVSLTAVKVTTTFTIPLTISDLNSVLNPIHFTNFKLQLPSGLDAEFNLYTSSTEKKKINKSKYDVLTGVIDLGDITLYAENSKYASKLEIAVSRLEGINEYWGCVEFRNDTLTFSDSLRIVEGGIAIRMKDFKNYDEKILPCTDPTKPAAYAAWVGHYQSLITSLPQKVTYACKPTIDPVKVTAFSGEIEYLFEGLSINPIQLTNIPELLKKKGTDIFLQNPQIYLSVNNPLMQKGYEVKGRANFNLEPVWDDGSSKTCGLNKDTAIVLNQATKKFMLSPQDRLFKKYPYRTAEHVPYDSLSQVLANDGNGLPSKIKINVIKPGIPRQAVTDFALDNTFEKVQGKYLFYAPLLLSKDADSITKIDYEDSVSFDDDIFKDLVIEDLALDFKVDNELPLDLELCVYPKETIGGQKVRMLNDEGEEIKFDVLDVIEALAKGQDIKAELSEAIPAGHVMTGIDFEAFLQTENGRIFTLEEAGEYLQTLNPEMGIKMNNLKITVSGHYNKQF